MTDDPQPTRYRQRPNEVDAIQWTGHNADALRAFAGIDFATIDPADRIDDPDQDAQLLVEASHWVGIKPGDWVLKFEGYFIAKDDGPFRAVWEPASTAPLAVGLPARLEAALTERFTELGNPFSRMAIAFKGPDGWPASREVGPHDVAEVLRELLGTPPEPDETDASEADVDRMLASGTPVQIVTVPPATFAAVPSAPADRAASTAPLAAGLPLVKGNCPACQRASLFLGSGGYVTCSSADCPEPDAATTVLEGDANWPAVRAAVLRELASSIQGGNVPFNTEAAEAALKNGGPFALIAYVQLAIGEQLRRMADEAQQQCPGFETQPNRCSCDCEGCRHNCAAHQAAAVSQPGKEA